MVERSAVSIFAVGFIYFFNVIPLPQPRADSLTKSYSCTPAPPAHCPGQVLVIASSQLEAWAQLCGDRFLHRGKLKRKPELGQEAASLIRSLTLACALLSSAAAALSLGLCGSLMLWLLAPWSCRSGVTLRWTQLHALTLGQVPGARPRHKKQ